MLAECFLFMSLCRTVTDKPAMMFLGADVAAKTLDVRQTERNYRWGQAHPCDLTPVGQPCGFSENDLTARPLVPHPGTFYGVEYLRAFGAAWLGDRMRHSHSRVIRRLWWMPQTLSLAGNAEGFIYSSRDRR